ncbi:MAG: helix-turn-helix transcriptional regulator [Myxococcales bacterium]|nr:helix-turn-helix transcriptional regulator [Myxococcales bacterium]
MLVSVQRFAVDGLGCARDTWALYGGGLRLHMVRHRRMGADDRLVPLLAFGRPAAGRNLVGLALEGRSYARMRGRDGTDELVGSATLAPGRGAFSARIEPDDEETSSLTIELDPAVHGGPALVAETGALARPGRAGELAGALRSAIELAWADPAALPLVAQAADTLGDALRAEGLPIPRLEPGASPPVSPSLRALARAVDLALSQRGARPMLVDVESASGRTARTLERAFPALCGLWGQPAVSFRDHARRAVLARACWAMTSPGATTEAVARAVGFASPNAFCRAMASYGLPSPGRVRERFRALG